MLLTVAILVMVVLAGAIMIYQFTRPRTVSSDSVRNKPNRYLRSSNSRDLNFLKESKESKPSEAKTTNSILGLHDSDQSTTNNLDKDAQQDTLSEASLSNIITLHVIAADNSPYNGYELLQAILSAGLRYGKMNIFHRFEQKTGRGRILFSLASINKPGTFDLPKMGGFSCPGLTLFMLLKELEDPMLAYEMMLDTANQLVDGLGGVVLDEHKKHLSKEHIIRTRQDIRDYVEKQRVPDLFET